MVICKAQSVVCPPSAVVTTVLALLHDTGEAALRMHHTVLCLCVCVCPLIGYRRAPDTVRLGKRLWDVRSSGVLRSADW
jgi:hypothetical protein